MPASLSIARTGRSRKRFEWLAASAICLRPILVSSSTFLPNSGLLASAATSSATYLSTTVSSFDFTPSSIGTRPAASAGATTATGSGASRVSLVSVAVAVVAMSPDLPVFAH
jgi:hypothetical protein